MSILTYLVISTDCWQLRAHVTACELLARQSQQSGTSGSHGSQNFLTGQHQPIFEGIFSEPRIIRSHTGPQKTVSFQMTTNDLIVAAQV